MPVLISLDNFLQNAYIIFQKSVDSFAIAQKKKKKKHANFKLGVKYILKGNSPQTKIKHVSLAISKWSTLFKKKKKSILKQWSETLKMALKFD